MGRAQAQAPQPPACELKISHDCNGVNLDAGGSRAADGSAIAKYRWTITGPAGAAAQEETAAFLNRPFRCPAGEDRCTLTYEVRAVDASGTESAPCRQTLEITRCAEPPVCDVRAREDRDGIEIDASASRADAGIGSLKVTAEDPSIAVQPAGRPNVFRAARPTKAGTYVFNTDLVDSDGVPVRCQAIVKVGEVAAAAQAPAAPAVAAAPDASGGSPWTFRAFVAGTRVTEDATGGPGGDAFAGFSSAGGTNGGYGAGYEFRHRLPDGGRARWGFGFEILDTSFDLRTSVDSGPTVGTDRAEVRLRPLLANAIYHLPLRNDAVDLWLGPTAGWAHLATANLSVGLLDFPARFEDAFVWGLALGADVPFGRAHRWLLTAGLRRLQLKGEGRGPVFFDLDLDPWIGTVGLGYRF